MVAEIPVTATPLLPPRSRACILDMVLCERGRRPGTGRSDGDVRATETIPTLRAICYVDLPRGENVTELSLSCDGKRLVIASSIGSVALWALPPFSSSPCMNTSRNYTAEDDLVASDGAAEDIIDNSVGKSDTNRNKRGVHPSLKAAAVATAAVQLGRPEIFIPHLPSPEQRKYNKILADYQRRVDAGEIEKAAENDATEVHLGADSLNLKPKPPSAPLVAYHLACVSLLSNIGMKGKGKPGYGGAEGAGLAIWRSRSNVWRLYRLPEILPGAQIGPCMSESTNELEVETVKDTGVSGECDGHDPRDDDLFSTVPITPIVDVACIPSAEWVLPSPVTFSVPCDAGGGVEGGRHNDAGRQADSPAYPPLVALGTENGGVYVCDGVLGTARKGLSMHRAKVTALTFHRRRCRSYTGYSLYSVDSRGVLFVLANLRAHCLNFHHQSSCCAWTLSYPFYTSTTRVSLTDDVGDFIRVLVRFQVPYPGHTTFMSTPPDFLSPAARTK